MEEGGNVRKHCAMKDTAASVSRKPWRCKPQRKSHARVPKKSKEKERKNK